MYSYNKKPLVVNFFAGPGAGKSTMASAVFAQLKWIGLNCELVSEFAKDLVWEERERTLENQIYIFGEQHHRLSRLIGRVQVIITDSPLLLTPIYDSLRRDSLKQLAIDEFNTFNNLNIFLNRTKQYNPKGRVQSEKHANRLDEVIYEFLEKNHIPHVDVTGSADDLDIVKKIVLDRIKV